MCLMVALCNRMCRAYVLKDDLQYKLLTSTYICYEMFPDPENIPKLSTPAQEQTHILFIF